ncbi:MAG: nucleoside transporter C-terminal domain-containing protein [Acidobacteriota bacterium]
MERVMSALGLLALLALAYAFSNNRAAVRPRTVAWGIGLQLLFAVIILSEASLHSFLGLYVLATLIALYAFETTPGSGDEAGTPGEGASVGQRLVYASGAAVATAVVVAVGFGVSMLGLGGWLVAAVALAVAAAVHFGWRETRWIFAGFVGLGLGALWFHDVPGRALFSMLSDRVSEFLALSNLGAEFMFSKLALSTPEMQGGNEFWPGIGFQFAFTVLPTIIFFSAFMSVLYYLGVVQILIAAMARFMHWSLQTSGSETMSCSANVFVGQTEAPFLIKPFLQDMTPSELHAVMVGGFATIAGGVLAGYIGMGVPAGHLIAASVMSAPAALVIAKLLFPETEESVTAGDVEVPRVETADNVVEAAAVGTTDGLKLALNVGAMLIAFIALIGFLDWVLGGADLWIDGRLLAGAQLASGEYAGIFPGSMRTLFGTVLAPLAFLMGVPWVDAAAVGNLLGIKLTVNEFVAYGVLSEHLAAEDLQPRSLIIATYALCGFANFSSIGIQIGGIGTLAPERRQILARIAFRALCGGALASFTTATVAGMLL